MAKFTTTITFADGDQITSAKLNEIISGLSFAADAVVSGNTTLIVSSGALKVGTITASELGAFAVTAPAIAADAVITSKLLDLNVTTGKLANDAVTTIKILDGNVTFAKLATAAVGTKAEVQASTASKLLAADLAKHLPGVAKAFGSVATLASSRVLTGAHNVASVARVSAGATSVTFTEAMSSALYAVTTSGTYTSASGVDRNYTIYDKSTSGFKVHHSAEATPEGFDFAVFGTLA